MPRLAVLGANRTPFTALLDQEQILVGRSSRNSLCLAEPTVSREHGRFWRTPAGWFFEDTGSQHGSLINGRRIDEPHLLEPGDRISVGNVVLVFDPPNVDALRTPTTVPLASRCGEPDLVGTSPGIEEVRELIDRFAPSDITVLVQGETGTGKELVARLLHLRSARAAGPFIVVNCPALPGSLVEAELFGTEKGVATGVEPRAGLAETADGGTLFLDEIGDLETSAQAKLLRFLQDRIVHRIGSRKSKKVDVRVVAATHHDLPELVETGAFRRDLYHRLEVATIEVPPLRDRRDDIPSLIAHGLDCGGGVRPLVSAESLDLLLRYDWPGNVRELEHALQRASLLAGDGEIRPELLPRALRQLAAMPAGPSTVAEELHRSLIDQGQSFWDTVRGPFLAREIAREDVRKLVARLLDESGGSYRDMATRLGLTDQYRKLIDFIRHNALQPRR